MLKKFLIGTFVALAMLVATSASAAWDFGPTTLKVGSRGEYVKTLQTLVGASPVDGIFGQGTKAKVMAWQANNGLVADGLFGNMSKAKANATVSTNLPAGCMSTTGFSTTTGQPCSTTSTVPGCTPGALFSSTTGQSCTGTPTTPTVTGGAGSVDSYDLASAYSNEDVGEGMNDVKVAGLEIEADNGSDLGITALRLVFNEVGSGNDDFEDYAKEVTIWYGSTKLATVPASEFNDDNSWTKTVSLASGAVVKAGQTGTFIVAISANNTIDSADITAPNGDWTVDFTSVRFVDGMGVTTSEDPQVAVTTFTFEDYASAANVELKVAVSNSPASGIVAMQDNTEKDNVTLLKGTFKAVGAEVELQDFPITVTSSGSDVDELATTFTLLIDGVEVDSKQITDGTADDYDSSVTEVLDCAGTSCTIIFDEINKDIAAGATSTFEVLVDVNEIDGTTVTQGDSLLAKATSTAVDNIEAESNGDDLVANDLTGSATGEAQYFYTDYAQITLVSKSFVPGTDATTDHIGTATFVIKAKAIGGTIYMNGDDEGTAGKEAFQLSTIGGGAGTSTLSAASYTVSGATSNGNSVTNGGAEDEYYTIAEDQEITFTITATITQTVATTTVGVEIDSVQFGVAATSDTTRSALPLNWSAFTDQLETAQVTLFV